MHGDVPVCGDLLAPMPSECWVCVEPAGHGPDEHLAEDGPERRAAPHRCDLGNQ